MIIDFSQYVATEISLLDFSHKFTLVDFKETAAQQADQMRDLIAPLTDAQLNHEVPDPNGENGLGWTVGHLILHMTASTEEGITFSSILARGIAMPFEPRLRYEPDWKTVTTKEQILARIAESRKMRLAYLETWPETPDYTTRREIPPGLKDRVGEIDALASVSLGLRHEREHLGQLHATIEKVLQPA